MCYLFTIKNFAPLRLRDFALKIENYETESRIY